MTNPTTFLALAGCLMFACDPIVKIGDLDGGFIETDAGSAGGGGNMQAMSDGGKVEGPFAGTANGAPFANPISVEVQRVGGVWYLSIRSYASTCGVVSGPPGADAVVITVGDIPARVGTETLVLGDRHASTVQTGVFTPDGGRPVTDPTGGNLVFDSWSDTSGAMNNGSLRLLGANSDLHGTFTARVCPPR